eukprot:712461-Rhodomonas_salina.1
MPRNSNTTLHSEDTTETSRSGNERLTLQRASGATERTSAINIREAAIAAGFTSAIAVSVTPDEAREDLRGVIQQTTGLDYIPDLATRWKKVEVPDGFSQCDTCGILGEKLQICTGCKTTRYCGKECQMASWKRHKRFCGKSVNNTRDVRPSGTGNVVRNMMQNFGLTMHSYAREE